MKDKLKKENSFLYRAKALRRAFKKLGHSFTLEQVINMMNQASICEYCHKPIAPLDYSIDHKIPLNKGGTNDISNLHLICIKCNKVKGDLTDEQFKDLMNYLADKPEVYDTLYKRLRMANYKFFYIKKKKS